MTARICAFDGCGRSVSYSGLCGAHAEQRRTGKVLAPLRGDCNRGPCDFDGCGRASKVVGLCRGHYKQRRQGKPLTAITVPTVRGVVCQFEECERGVAARGLCSGHYDQLRRGAPLTVIAPRVSADGPCAFTGCGRPVAARGLCSSHYRQQREGLALKPVVTRSATQRDEAGRKLCNECQTWKSESEFHLNTSATDKLTRWCKECYADNQRSKSLNITGAEYRAMLVAQGGVCAVCRRSDPSGRRLAVDHDHRCCSERGKSCGKCIRGLLCGPCNMSIGHMRDDASILRAAADYLDRATQDGGAALAVEHIGQAEPASEELGIAA